MSVRVLFDWINKQLGMQKFEFSVVTIKISMTECHHLIHHSSMV